METIKWKFVDQITANMAGFLSFSGKSRSQLLAESLFCAVGLVEAFEGCFVVGMFLCGFVC